MNNPFLRANPTELAVIGQPAPELAHISRKGGQGLAYDQRGKRLNRRQTDFITPAQGKG
jgi:hypothetical protein